ncbi:RNA-binding domain-containing protein [Rufibacter latericius]|nr:RNA-binding domain-containing protein [Rufibacter latericius]
MPIWREMALSFLEKSLRPIPNESNKIDWKENLSQNKERLAEHISAFANEQGGGWLVFGIDDSGNVKGINTDDSKLIIDKLGNIARNKVSPPVSLDHTIVKYEDEHLLIIYIPESNHKPVYIRGEGLEASFIRTAGQTRRVSDFELRELVKIGDNNFFEDRFATKGLKIEEAIDLLEVDVYYRLLRKKKPQDLELIKEELIDDNILVDLQDGIAITNLGALVLAKDKKRFGEIKKKQVRVIVYDGTNRVSAIKETGGIRGYAVGFEGLIRYILENIPSKEVIKTLREVEREYPEDALRELAANALIHQDFTVRGASPMIEIFDDRIEITNPGSPLIDPLRFLDYPPKSRNEKLAALMKKFSICEERGSGIDRVVQATENFRLPGPLIKRGEDYTRVTLFAHKELNQMTREEKIRSCYWHACLRHESNMMTDNASIRERFDIKRTNHAIASRIISDTLNEGLIKVADLTSNSKRDIKYVPYWAVNEHVEEGSKQLG